MYEFGFIMHGLKQVYARFLQVILMEMRIRMIEEGGTSTSCSKAANELLVGSRSRVAV